MLCVCGEDMHAGCRGCAQCEEDTGWVLRTPACHVEDLNSMERMWAGCRGHTVLCHHSPRWISLTVRQDPLYSDGDLSLYMQHAFYNHANHHSHPHHFFHPPFTSSQYLLLSKPSHPQATSSAHSASPTTSAHQRPQPDPRVPIISERSCGMWWKTIQWSF